MQNSWLQFKIFIVTFFCFLIFPIKVKSVQLVDIRTGFHSNYSRIVLQFDSGVQYNIIKDFENSRIIVETRPVVVKFRLGHINLEPDDRFLKQIEYEHSLRFLRVIVYLKSLDVRLDSYALERPFRVVIDIYQSFQFMNTENVDGLVVSDNFDTSASSFSETDPHAPIDSLQFHKNLEEEAPVIDMTSKNAEISEFLDTDDQNEYLSSDLYNATKAESLTLNWVKSAFKMKNRARKKIMILLVIGSFVLMDIILFSYLMAKRNRRRRISVTQSKQNSNSSSGSKLTNQDFKEILNSSIQEKIPELNEALLKASHSNVLQNSNISNKIHSMIESLSKVLSSQSPNMEDIPEIEEIAKELDKHSSSSGISKELLVGRDGAEFAKKINDVSANK